MNPATTTIAANAAKDLFKDALSESKIPEDQKDQYIVQLQKLINVHPELAGKLNDPVMLTVLHTAIVDGYARGQEKVYDDILPGMIDKINTAGIDLKKADADAKIKAEAEKAQAYYEAWKEGQKAGYDIAKQAAATNLDVNATGTRAYLSGGGRWASLLGFVAAIGKAFSQGSWAPIEEYIAEFRNPTKHEIHTTGVTVADSTAGNAYDLQNPHMDGATSLSDIKKGLKKDGATPYDVMLPGQSESDAAPETRAPAANPKGRDANFSANASGVTSDSAAKIKAAGTEVTQAPAAVVKTEGASSTPVHSKGRQVTFSEPTPNAAMGG